MRKHWPYAAVTAVLAAVVAVWAIPNLGDDAYFGYGGQSSPGVPAPLPSLSPDLLLLPMSAEILLLAVGVGLLVQIYSTAYLGHHRRYRSYGLIIILFLLAMAAVVATTNRWVLLVGWEVMGLCSYLLIAHDWETPEARAGAAKAFLITRVADLGLVLAIIVIGQAYGTYDILGALLAASDGQKSPTVIGLLILFAVVGKSAQFPLQSWLPDAMPGPTPITALIHAATMVAAGVYLAARLFPLYSASAVAIASMAVISGITMLLGALFALVQTDLKRALAWSTVSQLAFMFAAISASDPQAGIDHLISHGAFKALLFLGCGCLMLAVGSSALSEMGGLRRAMPVTFWTMTIGFAALAGVVPTAGFFTKDSVLESIRVATEGDGPLGTVFAYVLLVIAILTSFLTAAYATRLWLMAFFGPRRDTHSDMGREAPGAMTVPLVILAVSTVALSIGQPFHLGIGLLSTLVAASGIGIVVWRRRTQGNLDIDAPRLVDGLGLDTPWSRWIPALVRAMSREVVAIDRDAVDVYPQALAAAAGLGSRGLGLVQSRNVQRYATIMSAGVVMLVIAAVIWT